MRKTTLTGILFLSLIGVAEACTDFRLISNDNKVMVTRTMEFALPLDSHVRSSPQGREFKYGLNWTSKLGYVYMDALGQDMAVDGMNEAGLSFEFLYLPGETEYQKAPAGAEVQSLPYIHLGDWVLSNFKTVDEVVEALKSIYVVEYTDASLDNRLFPLHASIFERSGKGIVVEFVGGKVNIHEHIGVFTNAPTYEWHVTNLRNYISMSPYSPAPIIANGVAYAATGQGQGMLGLPGDSSPPSRFVKIAVMAKTAVTPANAKELLQTSTHIINTVDIPLGSIRAKVDGKDQLELTQWTVFKNLTDNVLYYRSYADSTLRSVSLHEVPLTPGSARINIPLSNEQPVVNMISSVH